MAKLAQAVGFFVLERDELLKLLGVEDNHPDIEVVKRPRYEEHVQLTVVGCALIGNVSEDTIF